MVSASASAFNYGWSIMEGTLCLGIGGACTTPGLTAPVYDYDHSQGCSIIGGYVYRGAAIPASNPVWPSVGRNENWAIGLRNPFRYAFDAGQLYIADVGQGAREEIDVVSATTSGLNYGWSIMEGTLCLGIGGSCMTPGLTAPVYDYDHGRGCAIIGGYVYRGTAMPELQGTYLFSDLCSGFVRGLTFENGVPTVAQAPMANAGAGVTQSFGQDGAGELYILTGDGRVLKVVRP